MVYLLDMKEFENVELGSKIFIENEAYLKLLSIISENRRNLETGGIIIGYYDISCRNAIITEFTKAPEDSKVARYRFYRGIKGLKNLLQKRWKERREYYLGEWHLHLGSSPDASNIDIEQMKKIAGNSGVNCKEPILLIVGEVAKTQAMNLMIFKNDQVYYYTENKQE